MSPHPLLAVRIDLAHSNLSERIYERLLDEITSGLWVPGASLTAKSQAERFGVSQTPVREAMLRLVSEGALSLGTRTFLVPTLARDEFLEIRKIRVALESMLTVEAVRGPDEALANDLAKIHGQLIEAKNRRDFEKVMTFNRDFHFRLYVAAAMPQAVALVRQLWARTGPYQYSIYADEPLPDPAAHDHLHVIAAVRAGNAQDAAGAVVDDIMLRGIRIEAALPAIA